MAMIPIKQSWLFQLLFLLSFISIIHTLQCKVCEKKDPTCLSGDDVPIETCSNDDDLCYSWFDRAKGHVGVQRGCMSLNTPEYRSIHKLLRGKESDCVKRINGLDCFKFCSSDICN